ncbi:phage protein NinX family protein [Pseudomonas extremaustralis]|uniref:phage protein NinX family protein n=1 Tax=Pseudomonas extremaustralis TaxID=359110 RepID=UPI002AA66EB3|nr:phage protein NinX family protein [Pseudomonas extremaustralis]
MKVKVSELSGPALDWAVAQVEKVPVRRELSGYDGNGNCVAWLSHQCLPYSPSTDWARGGPLLDDWDIQIASTDDDDGYPDRVYGCANVMGRKPGAWGTKTGPTILIAVMRAIVFSSLGEEIEIPDELLTPA